MLWTIWTITTAAALPPPPPPLPGQVGPWSMNPEHAVQKAVAVEAGVSYLRLEDAGSASGVRGNADGSQVWILVHNLNGDALRVVFV